MKVRIYATRNRRCPVIGLIGDWPPRAAFRKMATAGVLIAVRPASLEEVEECAAAVRHIGHRWQSLAEMLRDENDQIGKHWRRALVAAIRKKRGRIADCQADVARKSRVHARKRKGLGS